MFYGVADDPKRRPPLLPTPSRTRFGEARRQSTDPRRIYSSHDVSELEECSVAVDATYYLSQLLDTPPAHEPLLSALGGLTGIQTHINQNLDSWERNRIVPFFVFDGQSMTGQDEASLERRRAANKRTDEAWNLYSRSEAEQAVTTFGANSGRCQNWKLPSLPPSQVGKQRNPAQTKSLLGAYNVQNLYPLLQAILKKRGLHFLVPPYNACAQV